jgi:phage terminase large subunit-like protein
LPGQFDRIVQSWDTANKATELSDFSVHNLGSEGQGALPARRIPPAAGISGT